ncbi:MAG TPA: glycoside hydrolase family 76 protein [Niastella sp.]
MVIQKRIICFLLVSCFCSVHAQESASTYEYRVKLIYKNIYRFFYDSSARLFIETNNIKSNERPHAYLWPLCAFIQAANDMEQLQPDKKYMQPVVKAIGAYRSNKPPVPGYDSYVVKEGGGDRFYDDNQWIAIAYLDAYKRTGNKQFWEDAQEIYRFMMSGYDTVSGGGLYWKENDKTTKNTCSNGPGILIALRLYQATKEKTYLDTAVLLYEWTNKYLLAPQGVYYDNIKLPGLHIDKRFYTYNAGTMLQSNVLLYRITQNKKYLQEAQRQASASLATFYKDGRFPSNYWFNAVLLRGYIELYQVDGNKKYIQAMIDDLNKKWLTDLDQNNLAGPEKVKKLLDQAGLLEMVARIAFLQKNGF